MKKRLISLLLCLVLVVSLGTTAFAASEEATASAQKLYGLGLFNGTGKDANGNPIFDLDLVPSRNQAVTMLVRLLGKAEEAESKQLTTPFTDEAEWAKPYVGYAYANGLTAGTSATTYSGNQNTTVVQYLTFILRALGYQSGVDFEYSKAWEFADAIGLTDGRYNASTTDFRRSDIAEISYDALYVFKKGTTKMLGEVLASEGVISLTKFLEASPSPFAIKGGIKCYSRYPAVLSFENVCPATKFWQEFEIDYSRLGIPYNYNYCYTMANLAEAESYAQKYSDFLISNGYVLVKVGDNTITEDRDITYELINENGDYEIEIASSGFESCTVTVTITPPSAPSQGNTPSVSDTPSTDKTIQQLVLSESKLGVSPGEVMEISATCIPMYAYPELTWTSSNPSVATVQYVETVKKENVYNGTTYDDAYIVKAKVTAVSAGNAVITVTAQNGVKATINVSVLADNIAKAQAAVDALRSILKFPASLSLNSVRIYQGRYTDCVEIDYSAMNGFGGYNRGYYVYSGSSGTTYDYSVIDANGHSYVTVDISKLK